MTTRRELILKIVRHGANRLKVVWQLGNLHFKNYLVDPVTLDDYATKVRAELAAVVRAVSNGQLLRSGTPLRSLAVAGYDLRKALFCAVEGEGDGYDVEDWLTSHDAPRISLNVDDHVHIPWGLLYDEDPTKIPDNPECVDIDHYNAFWCIKYSVSVVHKLVTPFSPQARECFIWLSVLNGSKFNEVLSALAPPEIDNVQTVLVRHGNVVYATKDFETAWREHRQSIGLLFFYCHATGSYLGLSSTDSLDINKFRWITRHRRPVRTDQRPKCLVFLNGCLTAVGGREGGFLEATASTDFCGFIGVEEKIPDVFALRFGTAFIHRLLESGETVGMVMDELRRQHWPLSLLYSLSCDHTFRVHADRPSRLGNVVWASNFSHENVRSRELLGPRSPV